MNRILYIKLKNSSFIRIDEDILKRNFEVKSFLMNTSSGIAFILSAIKLVFFLLNNIYKSKAVFIRFADYYALIIAIFTKIFKKKLIIVVGGYDAVHIPEYQYGVYHSRLRGACVKFAFRNADLILPNNPTLINNINTYSNDYPRKEGVKHFVPDTKAKFEVVYNGFDSKFWSRTQILKTENSVVCCAYIDDYKTYLLKGIDDFIKLAYELPEVNFTLIGISELFISKHNISIPSNLKTIEQVDQKDLISLYSQNKVFCLLSLTEGMPNVMCEAMLCECIPVGSDVNAIPEIIGNTGFIVNERMIEEMKEKILMALNSEIDFGQMARKRIIENYSLQKRENELVGAILSVLNS